MSAAQTFAASGEDAISRQVEVTSENTPASSSSQFDAYYEISRTVQLIEEGNYKRIALQFPDELLHDSVPVYYALQQRLGPGRDTYVLADTSYGSCCVDEVAASHVEADLLVHYGHACMSQTSRLPVIYVFGRKELDIETCVNKISAYVSSKATELADVSVIELRHDVAYAHMSGWDVYLTVEDPVNRLSIDDLVGSLRLALGDRFRVVYDPLPIYTFPASAKKVDESTARCSLKTPEDRTSERERGLIIWVGEESPTLTKLLMVSSGTDIVAFSPSSGTLEPQSKLTNKLLKRRYGLLQKARDADVFGILIGTLGVASYLPLIAHLRTQLRKAHKKSYTLSVGKINPAKLANFMEVECWIWVACSEAMVDSKDYLRPIITPYELELALEPEPSWTGRYVLDFQELLANASSVEKRAGEEERANVLGDELDPDRPAFSLVTGTYRHAKRYGNDPPHAKGAAELTSTSNDLTRRMEESALANMSDSAAVQFLHSRSFQGLDPRLGQDAPGVLEQGRSGIARGYTDDHRGR